MDYWGGGGGGGGAKGMLAPNLKLLGGGLAHLYPHPHPPLPTHMYQVAVVVLCRHGVGNVGRETSCYLSPINFIVLYCIV